MVREMSTPYKNQLSEEEREELNAISAKVQSLRVAVVEQSTRFVFFFFFFFFFSFFLLLFGFCCLVCVLIFPEKKGGVRSSAEAERAALRELISGNLSKRRAELSTDHRVVFDVQQVSAEAEEKRKALSDAEQELAIGEERLADLEKQIDSTNGQIVPAQKAFDKLLEQGGHIQSAALQARKHVEELLHERAMYLREIDVAKRKIREVGTISSEEFLKFKDKDANELYSRLHTVQEKLQGYTHVNKKAGEQFVNFLQQRDDLTSRNQQLDESAEAITNLIKVLDSRKDEAILRTFKGVAMHFANVFKELVPDGEASLTMVKSSAPGGAAGKRRKPGADEADAAAAVLSFSGVKIKASFGGAMGAPQDLALLSGGQKSLVALALIFAIQRADPAPFYLMDEVDAALDSTHRIAVANLLKKSAEGENELARSQ
jgi:structural maintenance of chromosome 3 (chondroitin sulfate proteoglycan 6)